MRTTLHTLIAVARGEVKADLVLKDARVIDLFSSRIIEGDVAIVGSRIAGVGSYEGTHEIACGKAYVSPSLTDSHVHIESTCVLPGEYAKAVVPRGITSVVFDPHEITNVAGEAGIDFMLESSLSLPMDFHLMVPSCVPASCHDASGCVLDSASVARIMDKALGLAEMMDYPAVLDGDEEVLRKLGSARIVDGHAPFLGGNDLNAYAAAGIMTDHECSTPREMLERIERGIYVQLREGSYSKNLDALLPAITTVNYARCLLCTDDRFIGDILQSGSIDNALRKAVAFGMDPLMAIAMATINPAQCYGLVRTGAVAPGYAANLVVFGNLRDFEAELVIKDGIVVARDGEALFEVEPADTSRVKHSLKLPPFSRKDLTIPSLMDEHDGWLLAIELGAADLTTRLVTIGEDDPFSKVAVIERYGKSGSIGVGRVSNYGIEGGAVASTISHDSHNVIVVGDNDEDMILAVETLGEDGGIAIVSEGKVLSYLPLPIGGLMSELDGQEVSRIHGEIESLARGLGVSKSIDPLMALAFMSLPVIPEVRITSQGLFDVTNMRYFERTRTR